MNQSMLSANWNIHHRHRPDHAEFNSGILSGFEQLKNHPATNKTHLFHGRYENIYPDRAHFPQIEPLITWILAFHVFTMEPVWAAGALIQSALPTGAQK